MQKEFKYTSVRSSTYTPFQERISTSLTVLVGDPGAGGGASVE